MSAPSMHDDWLSLIEISGPFLAVPVLREVFPQGLEVLDGIKRKRLRQAYEEWREALETDDPQFPELHAAWIDEVLSRGLELDEDGRGDVLKRSDRLPANLRVSLPEHGVTLTPDLAVVDEQRADKPLMLIQTYPPKVDLDATLKRDGWAATPADRMVQLCRSSGCRIGLVTNGERWMLVDAPVGAVITFASWYARIWGQEPITLQAFVHLLGIRRFFVDESEQLPALLDRSLKYQDEVTDALGEQVRRAVEVLIQALDKADQDRDRELLHNVKEPELYEAALTVMMRLVFLLSAEERGLLLLGDERYEANYALSTLRMQLRTESEEILERRWDAWSRLLAIFRAVFGGIEHESLRLPALGGSLFDPDRFPFLEGRAKGTNWRTDTAKPLPIDNRTVLLLLEAIQQFQGRTLSYRALDVEQIGYVYEGLLERTVKRTDEVTLELDATKNAKNPWVKVGELESAKLEGSDRLAELLQDRSGCSSNRVRNDLARAVDDALSDRLLTVCQGDLSLRDRIKSYAHLVHTDPWGYPLVYPEGAFIVTKGSDRRETGTHYTPKSLTGAIVTETLTPIVYVGPAEGKPRDQWVLKSPAELLDLKICDPAMGSGAFLVQACRWLAECLVEAWSQVEVSGKTVSVDGEVLTDAAGKEPLPHDAEARTVIARRLIAERCLYGVDLNPLAVELAKLSIWLVTLAKERPFGFLDHNLRCGDSLLGIHRLDQLTELSMKPGGKGQQRLFGKNIKQAVNEAIELRLRLREMPIRDIKDVETMVRLDADARRRLEIPERIADAFIGDVFAAGSSGSGLENALASLSITAEKAADGDRQAIRRIIDLATRNLSVDLPAGKECRSPFHWPLEFPEVCLGVASGFDAIIGNPPFLKGHFISRYLGEKYREAVVALNCGIGASAGLSDLVAFFFAKAYMLLSREGVYGLLATNTIADGDTNKVGLAPCARGDMTIFRADTDIKWPGKAGVVVTAVWAAKKPWRGKKNLSGRLVEKISSQFTDDVESACKKLQSNFGLSFNGSYLLGEGFVLSPEEAANWLTQEEKYSKVILKYINGKELYSNEHCAPKRWVICFWDWPEQKAKEYTLAYDRLFMQVKPIRDGVNRERRKKLWWIHAENSPGLYHSLGFGENFIKHPNDWMKKTGTPKEVICKAKTSSTWEFVFMPAQMIFDQTIVVISSKSVSLFSQLQSTFHREWAVRRGSSLKTDMSYTASTVFETFPFLKNDFNLDICGNNYIQIRQKCLQEYSIGLTKYHNALHDKKDRRPCIILARDIYKKLDEAVADAFGWNDLDLEHGFHEVDYLPENDRVRYTISEPARIEVLRRLSELNRQRYEEEVAQGLHGGKSTQPKARASKMRAAESPEQSGFDFGDMPVTRHTTE